MLENQSRRRREIDAPNRALRHSTIRPYKPPAPPQSQTQVLPAPRPKPALEIP
jgi:hypothetical protein